MQVVDRRQLVLVSESGTELGKIIGLGNRSYDCLSTGAYTGSVETVQDEAFTAVLLR